MNIKYIVLVLLASSFVVASYAQDYSFKDHDFLDDQVKLSKEDKSQDALILFQDRRIEISVGEESVQQFYLYHEQILVNSNKAIEENNRIYIGVSKNSRLVKNKNRVILPNGKIIELKKEDILEEVDPETGYKYEYYAVKGLEKGAIIEKLYIKEEAVSFTGRSISFQKSYPIKRSTFHFISPNHLVYKYNSYNDLPEATIEKSEEENRQTISVVAENIVPLPLDEKQSNPAAHKQKFRYKLFENVATGKRNFYNYNDFAKNLFSSYDVELSKQDKSALKKFYSNTLPSSKEKVNIYEVESRIKNSITFNEDYDGNKSLADVLKNQEGKLIDMLILYRKSFELFDIESEFVFTSNRYEFPFDLELETTNNLRDVLIYFPNSDQYLDIENPTLRSPLITAGLAYTDGIKIKEVNFAGNTMATTEPIFTDINIGHLTTDTMQVMVDFTKDIENPNVQTNLQFGGYTNAYFQPIKSYVNPDEYDEILKSVFKSYTFETDIDNVNCKNDGIENIGLKNFEVDLKYSSKDFLQKAGNKYLYKVGQVIGKQDELYTEKERVLPVELEFNRNYVRDVTIKIPEGYKVSNPEILNVEHEIKKDGKITAYFTATYQMEGNILTIENKEGYDKIHYPLKDFAGYREIYNAAADYNKLTLVLEKI